MKYNLLYLISLLFLLSCSSEQNRKSQPTPLFPQPKTIEANPEGGYAINVTTRDSIKPIINSLGDTVKTGVPIPAQGKVIHSDSTSKPKSTSAPNDNQLTKVDAHPNVQQVPNELTVISVDQDSLKIFPIKVGDGSHFMLNSTGDTVLTGIPISINGKAVERLQPKPIEALPPRFKDNTINNIQYLDVDQGMASSYAWSILEDRNGNLWIGTNGGGVSKYDGTSFTHFGVEEGLSSNYIQAILEDKSGNLWFGAYDGGISKFDGNSFTHFTEKEGLPNNAIVTILEDKSGNLWFGSLGGGVSKLVPSEIEGNNATFTHYTENEGLSGNVVMSILEDRAGNLWMATDGGGVTKYNGKFFTHFTEKDGLSNNSVLSILEDKSGNLWFGTYGGGVNKFEGTSFTHFTDKKGLSENTVMAILEDKSGNLWFATDGGGMNKYDGNSFTHYSEKQGLTSNYIWSILEDKSGNLWFATDGGGLCKYDVESFTYYSEEHGLSSDNIMSILQDKRGNLWFGSNGGGVSKYDGQSFTQFTDEDGLCSNYIRSIVEDKNGNIWFATYGEGVSKFDGKVFSTYTEAEGLTSASVRVLLADKSGNVWFGTNEGVTKYDGVNFTHFGEAEGMSNSIVLSMIEDEKGNLWFGTFGGGVTRYNGQTQPAGQASFKHFTEKEGLSNNDVLSIYEDKSGNLWFGTYGGGVNKYDGNSITHFTNKEGLSNNTIWSIIEDKSGNLWLSTENGLNQLVYDGKKETKDLAAAHYKPIDIIRFEKNDGLKGLDFYPNSVYLDSDNRIWWGSGKGLTMLAMDNFNLAQNPPDIQFAGLDINEELVDFRHISDSLNEKVIFDSVVLFENYPLNLKLNHDQNHLTFHYSAIDWHAPHKVQYSFRLLGQNNIWSNPTTETKADFRELDFGKYTFQLKAIGESGEWSDTFEYQFSIHPPWWHTWWARAFYGLAITLIFWGFVRWRTAQLKERQQELEVEVALATKEIRKKKEEVEQQKEIVEVAHREITDSIEYAERIQRSFLASKELLDENLKDYFVFFQPKEVVSGDFYWAGKLKNGKFVIVNADSTGHGVPGAIMSILNISSIEKAIEKGYSNPADIFNDTRATIIERLKNDGSAEGGKDGMDASIISFDFDNNKFSYTAALNPIWIVRNGNLTEIKPEKMPIGKHDKDHIPFEGGEFEMQKGDQIYTITDGFQDQFGGPKGKKFLVKKMREYILSISHLPMQEQYTNIQKVFSDWKGNEEQVDDVCVIGVRV